MAIWMVKVLRAIYSLPFQTIREQGVKKEIRANTLSGMMVNLGPSNHTRKWRGGGGGGGGGGVVTHHLKGLSKLSGNHKINFGPTELRFKYVT